MSRQIIRCIAHFLIRRTTILLLIAIVSLIKSKLNIFILILFFNLKTYASKLDTTVHQKKKIWLRPIPSSPLSNKFLSSFIKFQIDFFSCSFIESHQYRHIKLVMCSCNFNHRILI